MSIGQTFGVTINNILVPFGYSNNQTTAFGGIIFIFGVIGAVVFSVVLGTKKNDITLLRISTFSFLILLLIFLFTIAPGRHAILLTVVGLIGFFLFPLQPICLYSAVKIVPTVSETMHVGIMVSLGNIIGVLLTYLVTAIV